MKDFLKDTVNQFFIIATGSLMGSALFVSMFSEVKVEGNLLWQLIVTSLFSAALNFIFYSPKEYNRRQFIKRSILHYIGIVGVLLGAAIGFKWIDAHRLSQILIMVVIVTLVYVFVWVMDYQRDKLTNKKLNQYLENYKQNKNQVK